MHGARALVPFVLLLVVVCGACRTSVTEETSPPPTAGGPAAGGPSAPDAPADLPAGIEGVDPELLKPGPWKFEAGYEGVGRPYARFRDRDWAIHTITNTFKLKVSKKVGMGASLSISGDYENRQYNFDGATELLPETNDPVTIVNGFGGRFRYIQPFHPEWAAFVGGRTRIEAEQGAPLSDGFSWAAYLGIGHRTSFGLEVGVGVGYLERPGESYWIPVVQGSWEVNDVLTLSLDGLDLEAEARTSEQWAWALGLGFDSARIRLTDDPPGNSGIFTDSRFTVDVRARYTPIESLELELRLGLDVWRKLFFSDEYGNPISEFGLKPAPMIGAQVTVRF